MKYIALGFVIILGILSWYFFYDRNKEGSLMDLNYIVTETKGPDSFDPINADKTQNLSVMRMLYATPIEIDKNNILKSRILKSFEHDSDLNLIVFDLKENQTYADGTSITVDDLAMAIARMAYFRPQFPVIKDIEGVSVWSASKQGLESFPSGIRTENNRLIIKLTRRHANPLFRFCLELFAVIPQRCIEKKTGVMNCEQPPESGYFVIKTKAVNEIIFEKRSEQETVDVIPYSTIRFRFKSLDEACRGELQANDIISGIEIDYLSSECVKNLQASQVHWMPSSRFGVLRFNPNVVPFVNIKSRQFFAETVREILYKKDLNLQIERGLFSKLLPGYIPNEVLSKTFRLEDAEVFVGKSVTLPKMRATGFGIIYSAIGEAAERLGMAVTYVDSPSSENLVSDFVAGKVGVIAGASGFWAQDPIGDIAMWFTPNLHKTMSFVWGDRNIYQQIAELEEEGNAQVLLQKMEKFNHYIAEQSLLAPILHFRRLFVSSSKVESLNLPQAVTSPAPWQVIPVE